MITRGPYLQRPAPDGIVVRWRTDVPTDSRVLCGPAPGSLSVCGESLDQTTEHEVELGGLSPDTRYSYAIGTASQVLSGDDAEHFFLTSPQPGARRPLRIWAFGDSGTADATQAAVRDAYLAFTAGAHTDLWLMLGDNAYPAGTDAQYQAAVFDIYPSLLRQTPLWPTLGNHDLYDPVTRRWPYYDSFTLPTSGESGGLGSGTEAYYSFDWANVHFVVLDSFDLPRTPGSPMLLWLEEDLAATEQDWIVAFWHHPPYSKGSHDSDLELELFEMRQYALPVLEDHGVDLVLTAHSHSYERSLFLDGHYGASSEFGVCDDAGTAGDPGDDFCAADPRTACPGGVIDCDSGGFIVDAGDGRPGGDGAYGKPLLGPDPHRGTVYAVAGTGGAEPGGGSLDHPAMFLSLDVNGSIVLELDGERLDATFLGHTGQVLDSFSIVKGLACPSGPYLDPDGDGLCNDLDNCPDAANPEQDDADDDGAGDPCDVCPADPLDDADDDTVCGGQDNCPLAPNPGQQDQDGDGDGDACDVCPADPLDDADSDTVCGDIDNCPLTPNPSQADEDGDGAGDPCDPCPADPANDADGDGICGDLDNCPLAANPCQIDSDGDGVGDVCDAPSPETCNAFASQDSWLSESFPAANYGGQSRLVARGGSGGRKSPVIRYDLGAIPAGSTLVSATAWLFVTDPDHSGDPVRVHRIVDDWTEGGVNWSNTGADFDATVEGSFSAASAAWVGVDLTPLVQGWIDGASPNQGLVLRPSSTGVESRYASREASPSSLRSCISIVYRCLGPDHDADGDGTPDASDGCPNDPLKVEPGICGCGSVEADADGDGPLDCVDNCPAAVNSAQADADGDGRGDLCDGCPLDPADDGDGDAVCAEADNCPATSNAAQLDTDGDAAGDACDGCPADPDDDADGDTICGDVDNCPGTPNAAQADADGDGVGDACDLPGDADGDGVADDADDCPANPNPLQQDADDDGAGDACDADDDADGVEDALDCAPLAPGLAAPPGPIGPTLRLGKSGGVTRLTWSRGVQGHLSHVYRGLGAPGQSASLGCFDLANPGTESIDPDVPPAGGFFVYAIGAANACGATAPGQASDGTPRGVSPPCPAGSQDHDADGVADGEDNCPLDADAELSDGDRDFVGDLCDNCPTVSNPDQADADGRGGDACAHLVDADGDGIEDSLDNCPADANTTQTDEDLDDLGDACDACPTDPANATTDADGDGTLDCNDLCPHDPAKVAPGICGCGVADATGDPDGDGVCGEADTCPHQFDPCQTDTDGDGVGNVCDTFGPESCTVFAAADSWLRQTSPGQNHGSDDELSSRQSPGNGMRPVIRFDLAAVPQATPLLSARAWLYVTERDDTGLPVNLHRITDGWTEHAVTWSNTASDFDPAVSASFTAPSSHTGLAVDLTALVRAWVDGSAPNHGLMLRSTSNGSESKYASRESQAGRRPCLEVLPLCDP